MSVLQSTSSRSTTNGSLLLIRDRLSGGASVSLEGVFVVVSVDMMGLWRQSVKRDTVVSFGSVLRKGYHRQLIGFSFFGRTKFRGV